MLTVVHKERKKEAKKERKDYGYYTLIIYKNGLDKPDHLNDELPKDSQKTEEQLLGEIEYYATKAEQYFGSSLDLSWKGLIAGGRDTSTAFPGLPEMTQSIRCEIEAYEYMEELGRCYRQLGQLLKYKGRGEEADKAFSMADGLIREAIRGKNMSARERMGLD